MRQVTKKSLDELAKVMPVLSETQQRGYVGGTSGSTGDMPPPSTGGGGIDCSCGIGICYCDDGGSMGDGSDGYSGNYTKDSPCSVDVFQTLCDSGNWEGGYVGSSKNDAVFYSASYDDDISPSGVHLQGAVTKTDCVAYTIAWALGRMGDIDKIRVQLESKYGTDGVPGDKYYEAMNMFCVGSPTPIPLNGSYIDISTKGLTAAIRVSEGGHSVCVFAVENGRIYYYDPQNDITSSCSTLDVAYLYRVDGGK